MNAVSELIDHWRAFDPSKDPLVHDLDRSAIQGVKGLTTTVLPYPFVGDIAGADIWFLMLNSNVGDSDRNDESRPYMANLLRKNLAQDWSDTV